MRLVLFVLVLTLAACSGPAPVAPHPAAKTTCSLCDFLGNEDYTIADGEGAHESPDSDSSSETEAEADSTQAASSLLADSNLESVVRQALDQSQGPLTPEDVASLISLSASDKSIHSVAGLEHFTALQKLDLRNNQITDVTPLSHLITLEHLDLSWNQIADVTPLAALTDLMMLRLEDNLIADVTPLSRLTRVKWLDLKDNLIADVTPLNRLTRLSLLKLETNLIEDVAPLVANLGLGRGDEVYLADNILSAQALNEQIPTLQVRGVSVTY